MIYRALRAIGFRMDPERAHAVALQAHRLARPLRRRIGRTEPVTVMGLEFPNRVGLAAGYDKDAVAWRGLAALGFGHVEIGTVTPAPQPGRDRPRVFRLPEDSALINRMGFPSAGADVVAGRLVGGHDRAVLGVSIGPNGFTDPGGAAADYEALVDRFAALSDYLAVNVSSPNTPGLRTLQQPGDLAELLCRIISRRDAQPRRVPVAVKLSPDIAADELEDVVGAIEGAGADGIILTNTTLTRPDLRSVAAAETGGLSGAPLTEIALEMLRQVRSLTALPLIASGGVMSVEDATERFDAGASLVQLYTGFVYAGPRLVRQIARL